MVIHGKEAALEAGDLACRDSRPPPDGGRGRENREVAGNHGTEPTLEAASGRGREVQWAGGYTFHWRGRDGRQTLTQRFTQSNEKLGSDRAATRRHARRWSFRGTRGELQTR